MADVSFSVDKEDSTPLWIQLRNQIIENIKTGVLEPRQKMPTVRNLAQELSVSPSVINQCYRYLKAVGYLEAKQGSGVRVRRRFDSVDEADFVKASKLVNDFIDAYLELGMPLEGIPDSVSYAVAARNLDPNNEFSVLGIYEDYARARDEDAE